MAANTLTNMILWIQHAESVYIVVFKKSTSRDIRTKDTPGMTPTKYIFYHILFAVNDILEPFSTKF